MNNSVAKDLVDQFFNRITIAEIKEQIEELLKDERIAQNRMSTENYPQITFNISSNEIKELIDNNLITIDLLFNHDLPSKIDDPLTKILYALAWKNGDIPKIKHILRGINDIDSVAKKNDEAVVFYQFGKHLANRHSEPIIDQHVIRAFAMFRADKSNDAELERIRKIDVLNKSHVNLISDYKEWLVNKITPSLKAYLDYAYHIDLILFALGKTIKLRKNHV